MKKIISLVLTVFILCMHTISYATDSATLTATASGCTVGEQVKVSINISEYSRACGGSFEIKYDNTRLSLVSAVKGSAFSNINTTINAKFTSSSVKVVWLGTKSPDGGEVVNMVFDAVGAGKAFVEFKNVMLADLEAESIPYSVVNAEVDIASNEFEIEKFNSPSSAVISCPDDSKTAEVVFVSYNEGRVVSADIVSVTLKKGVNEVFVSEVFSCENADTVKILLWEGLEYITPLCKPLTVSL